MRLVLLAQLSRHRGGGGGGGTAPPLPILFGVSSSRVARCLSVLLIVFSCGCCAGRTLSPPPPAPACAALGQTDPAQPQPRATPHSPPHQSQQLLLLCGHFSLEARGRSPFAAHQLAAGLRLNQSVKGPHNKATHGPGRSHIPDYDWLFAIGVCRNMCAAHRRRRGPRAVAPSFSNHTFVIPVPHTVYSIYNIMKYCTPIYLQHTCSSTSSTQTAEQGARRNAIQFNDG